MRLSNLNKKEKGTHVKNVPCPKCREVGKDRHGDNLGVFELPSGKFDATCWSCGHYVSNYEDCELEECGVPDIDIKNLKEPSGMSDNGWDMAKVESLPFKSIRDRLLSEDTVRRYKVRCADDRRFYPVMVEGKITGYRCRKLPKEFQPKNGATPVGDLTTKEFFGQSLFDRGNGILIITEGEEDAMSAYQMTEKHSPKSVGYTSISVPSGKGSLKKCVVENLKYLSKFDKVIFALDQEPETQLLVEQVAKLLPPKKAYIAKFELKDASDMLTKGKDYEFYKAIWNAELYRPEGVISGEETWQVYQNSKHRVVGLPLPEKFGLEDNYLGMVKGNLDVIGAFEKAGKSTMIKEICVDLRLRHKKKIAMFMLEEFPEETVGDLLSMRVEKRIDMYPDLVSKEQQRQAWDELFADDSIVFSDGHSFLTVEGLLETIRFMALTYGTEYFFLDNLTKITRLLIHERDSETFITAQIMTQLERLCKDLDIYICLVSHVRKEYGEGKSYTEGKVMRVHDLYGSGDISKTAYNIIAISRNNSNDPNISCYHLIASRRGKLGHGNFLTYDFEKGIMEVLRDKTIEAGEECL